PLASGEFSCPARRCRTSSRSSKAACDSGTGSDRCLDPRDTYRYSPRMPHRLLLADDSVTIQKVIELTFADEDVLVTAVGDGDAAVARLSAEAFDVVLADVGMPGRDG